MASNEKEIMKKMEGETNENRNSVVGQMEEEWREEVGLVTGVYARS